MPEIHILYIFFLFQSENKKKNEETEYLKKMLFKMKILATLVIVPKIQ